MNDVQMRHARWKLGDRVETSRAFDRRLSREGVIVAVFFTAACELRYVVERADGKLTIHNAGQLREAV